MKKVLVTGGGGFLGSYIVERLIQRGDEVTILGRNRYPELERLGARTFQADIRDKAAVQKACQGMEIVFHVAAMPDPWGEWKLFYDINYKGTQNVIEACQKHGVPKLVYTSSPSVVFDGTDMEGVDETYPYPSRHMSYYTATKAMAEQLIISANAKGGLLTTALRPHLIFGPRDNHLFPRVIQRAKTGRLVIVGNAKNKVDVVYVENAAEAHLLAADSPKAAGQVYFITQGEPVVLWEFVARILKGLNLPPITKRIPYPVAYVIGLMMEVTFRLFAIQKEPMITRLVASELAKSHYFNIDKARKELGYEPRIGIDEGLDRTIEYFKQKFR
nr:NAD-dependent epimerase/dehydratase family protein [Desulfobacterales bacterium]